MRHDSSNLDLLRSVAITLVVLDHLFTFFNLTELGFVTAYAMGHLGVLLFFVHTSLVLMFSLERQQAAHPGGRLFPFFILRRCFRVFPLSMFVVALTFAFRLPLGFLAPGSMTASSESFAGFIANLFLVQNLTLSESIVGPLWSLPLEMQMYLFLPALFLLVNRSNSIRLLVGIWLLAVVAAIAQSRIHLLERLNLLWYIPNFLPGVIAYRLSSSAKVRLSSALWPICLGGLIVAFMLLKKYEAEDGWLICLLTGLAIPYFKDISTPWVQKACHHVAKYSYGVYLGHFLCIWIAFIAISKYSPFVQWCAFVASMVVLTMLMYHWIEAPMISFSGRLATKLFPISVVLEQQEGHATRD